MNKDFINYILRIKKMQTHKDDEHYKTVNYTQFEKQFPGLLDKARSMTDEGKSDITTGNKTELIEYEYNRKGFHLKKLPDDEHGILRISIGGVPGKIDFNYCVIRGKYEDCVEILENALCALKNSDVKI